MFDRIASYYDTTNGIMSLGLHGIWKDVLVQNMDLRTGHEILDLACGTGDVSIKSIALIKEQGGRGLCYCFDASKNMLAIADSKIEAAQMNDQIQIKQGFAEDLEEFEDDKFDRVAISFGIRNFENRSIALQQIKRKLKSKNGVLGVLEFVAPSEGPLKGVVNFFLTHVIPLIGSFSSGGMTHEYTHLRNSIQTWSKPADFLKELHQAGFESCKTRNVLLETVFLFTCSTVDDVNSSALELELDKNNTDSLPEEIKVTATGTGSEAVSKAKVAKEDDWEL